MGIKRSLIKRKIRNGAKQSAHELASCYGKIRHSSYEAAVNSNKEKISFVNPYKCRYCAYYHVGRKRNDTNKK